MINLGGRLFGKPDSLMADGGDGPREEAVVKIVKPS